MNANPRLTLGPLLYYWPRERVFAFYEEAAGWPVDTVYVGETVCSKRHELRPADWRRIARALADRGKEVVLSTCELVESESDLRAMRRITSNGEFRVEANDLGAVRLLSGRVPFVAGSYLNIYSRPSLDMFRGFGATRWVTPLELSGEGLREVLRGGDADVETEVFAFGRLPLAVSARCFTARYHNLSKDDCGFRCMEHPDGLTVATQDDEPFLAMNGLQTQSARVQDLAAEIPAMRSIGVGRLRISPQSEHTGEVVRTYVALRDGAVDPLEASRALSGWARGDLCDGYWHGLPGMQRVARAVVRAPRPG